MNQTRKIIKIWKSKLTIEGAGGLLKRAFGFLMFCNLIRLLNLERNEGKVEIADRT